MQTLEAFAHVRRSGGKVDSRGRPDAEHHQHCSSAATSCRSVPASNPGFTSIRRPSETSTASSPPHSRGPAISTATHRWGRCPALSAFGNALCNVPASSWPRLSESRTPRGSARSLRNRPPVDLLPPGLDAAAAVVLIPYSSPSHSSIRSGDFIGALL
jgi:hypothetical protein